MMLEQIGYYHLCALDPSILTQTDFDGFQQVFEGAWSRIVAAVRIAQSFGIGVLFGVSCTALRYKIYLIVNVNFRPSRSPWKTEPRFTFRNIIPGGFIFPQQL